MRSVVRNLFLALFLCSANTAFAQQQPAEGSTQEAHPRYIKVTVKSSIAASLNGVLGAGNGDALSAHVGRLAIWWLNLKKDVLQGDQIEILYKMAPAPARYEIHALRYTSLKKQQTFAAFLYNNHYYDQNGQEIEQRLKHAPIYEYDQVTERMNLAGRNHRGVDYKAAEGTPLYAPYNGVIERIWSASNNGNSLKIKLDHKDQRALYLHLSSYEPGLKVGMRVKAGQKVAYVGNTGRSTSAHLHYEIHDKNDQIMDPFLADDTYTKSIPDSFTDSFNQWINYYLALFNHGK